MIDRGWRRSGTFIDPLLVQVSHISAQVTIVTNLISGHLAVPNTR
jgi:hypothetical protein